MTESLLSTVTATPPHQPEQVATVGVRSAIGRMWRRPEARFGLLVAGVITVLALGAPLFAAITGHGPNDQFPDIGLSPEGLPVGPNAQFWFGTDSNGRDVFVRTLYGLRVSLLVGVPATTIAMLIGTAVGMVSGYYGGMVDRLLSQLIDVVLSFPFILTALTLITLNRSSEGGAILNPALLVIFVIVTFAWTYFARLTRGMVQELRSRPFVEAARTLGASDLRILAREILPMVVPAVVVYWAVQLPQNIIAEATLSFLGVGVVPPNPSLGNIISDAQVSTLYQTQPWYLIGPAIMLFLTVLAFNAISGGIRDVLDPHSHTR
ncbi:MULTISPECIES: ABC transporter permease [unclassified Mycobacterium]|uniref:ABC transporter permease n=1 Tax=unclassified Mycobacterium TaxID=2642494 RepID=UPI0029C76750|nr:MULTISPECIES: ABC transporter permease [unclassified Mycobacterium]